ncbi:hypothetical protein TSAR_013472 [Trichomalopsis sarcophagae]|uniref:RRM domain-containing protein n=1 Tax=Trichomalopsis sarcophagae TaxID=543379 RepID=A0A232EJ15_9HYME|nr:hypothetical protein TSAR_013472 [Trichomalopsis sarcophagae]
MEAGFLNFHDEEHFSDFSLSLDHQHNLLGESQSSLAQIVDSDFDYVESLGFDSNDALWETEQELNGDLAVLPVSGVSGVIPKMENIKEDFAKVLTDWQEHIGYLQASEIEEDINLDMGLHINEDLAKDIFEDIEKSANNILKSPVKLDQPQKQSHKLSPVKFHVDQYESPRVSESDQSEKEIGKKVIKTKQEPVEVKEELLSDLENEPIPEIPSPTEKLDCAKSSKKKHSKKHKEEVPSKRSRKSGKEAPDFVGKIPKKLKKDLKSDEIIKENSSTNVPSISKKAPALEAGDVKSLLEQFEATEAAAISSEIPDKTQLSQASSKKSSLKFTVNKSQVTLLKKSTDSQDSKFHQDIRDSLPKEVIDRIKASSGRKKMISVIPAIPNTKIGTRNNGTRMQEAAATLSRNKLLKLVTNNSNSGVRVDGSVQLDHDYCSNSNTMMSSSSNSCDSNSEYDRQSSDSEQLTPVKQESSKEKNGCYGKGGAEHLKSTNHKTSAAIRKNNWTDSSSKKDSGLESGDVSDASEEQTPASKVKKSLLQDTPPSKESKELKKNPAHGSILDSSNKVSLINKPPTTNSAKPVYEMKIQSALATSILQLRKGVLTKTKSLDNHKPKQMVSVLKKPPVATTPQKIFGSNLKESIVTTTNSSNDQVQNIIVQDTAEIELPEETEKKPPRRKLNLAEYRSRREQNRSDGSRTNSPIQPMTLLYIHHASTNTEPINDDLENPVWSEREIVSVLKPKAELEEEKLKPKRPTRDRGMQTTETVFGIVYEDEEDEEQEEQKTPGQVPEAVAEQVPEQKQKEQIMQEQQIAKKAVVNSNVNLNVQIATKDAVENMVTDDQLEVGEIVDDQAVSNDNASNKIPVSNANAERQNEEENASMSINPGRLGHAPDPGPGLGQGQDQDHGLCIARLHQEDPGVRGPGAPGLGPGHRDTLAVQVIQIVHYDTCDLNCSFLLNHLSQEYPQTAKIRKSRLIVTKVILICTVRSSSRSNFGHSKWSSHRRKGRRERRRSYDRHRRSSGSSHGYNDWRRSPSHRRPYDEWYVKEKQRQVEERRVIYVGRLKEGITKAELRRRFEAFGPVVDISIHFRERGHNYGFVTFAYKNDAYEAVEHGNDDPSLPRYDLCFGGRRAFCKVKYADLDGAASNSLGTSRGNVYKPEEENTFDLLLKEAQAKLRKRKV